MSTIDNHCYSSSSDYELLVPPEYQEIKQWLKDNNATQDMIDTAYLCYLLCEGADEICMLLEANRDKILEQVEVFWKVQDEVKEPIGFENMKGRKSLLAKLGRYIFQELDKRISDFLKDRNLIFEFPIIEHAINVIPDIEESLLKEKKLSKETVRRFISNNYSTDSLKIYLQGPWRIILENFKTRMVNQSEILQQLNRNGYCFPAIKSCITPLSNIVRPITIGLAQDGVNNFVARWDKWMEKGIQNLDQDTVADMILLDYQENCKKEGLIFSKDDTKNIRVAILTSLKLLEGSS